MELALKELVLLRLTNYANKKGNRGQQVSTDEIDKSAWQI